jgi:hypothetical protein
MVLPPYSHKKCFSTGRWHSFKKVINDLKEYGEVRLYSDYPNEEEVKNVHSKIMSFHDKYFNK